MSNVTDARSRSKGTAVVAAVFSLIANAWSASQVWVSFADVAVATLGLRRDLTGRELSTAVAVLPLLGLATTVAMLVASRLWVRVSALASIVTAGIAVGYAIALLTQKIQMAGLRIQQGISETAQASVHPIPVVVCTLGCLVFMAAGFIGVLKVPSWSGLSRRYQRQSAHRGESRQISDADVDGTQMWAALDRGEDPTAGESRDSSTSQPRL